MRRDTPDVAIHLDRAGATGRLLVDGHDIAPIAAKDWTLIGKRNGVPTLRIDLKPHALSYEGPARVELAEHTVAALRALGWAPPPPGAQGAQPPVVWVLRDRRQPHHPIRGVYFLESLAKAAAISLLAGGSRRPAAALAWRNSPSCDGDYRALCAQWRPGGDFEDTRLDVMREPIRRHVDSSRPFPAPPRRPPARSPARSTRPTPWSTRSPPKSRLLGRAAAPRGGVCSPRWPTRSDPRRGRPPDRSPATTSPPGVCTSATPAAALGGPDDQDHPHR